MSKFKVKKGMVPYREVPIEEWSTDQMCVYMKDKFLNAYEIETRRPIGQIKCYVNQKTISRLFILEGRSLTIHPNELYRDFIDWVISKKTVDNFRIWFLGNEGIMVDFLDQRARKMMDKKLGSVEDFKKQEEQKLEEAKKFFGFIR